MEEPLVERRIREAIERGELLEAPQIESDPVRVGKAICGAVARAARREAARAGKEAQLLSTGRVFAYRCALRA